MHMLREDINNQLMPFGNSSRNRPDYKVTVEPPNEAASECLMEALGYGEREYDLASALEGFVRRVVNLFLNQGEAYFELLLDSDEAPKRFLLAPLPPGEIQTFEGIATQIIPREVQVKLELPNPSIEISRKQVVSLHFSEIPWGEVCRTRTHL